MSIPKPPMPAKLVIGMFMKNKELFEPLTHELVGKFGPIDIVSAWIPFDFTSYYEPEMGQPLFRRMLTFQKLIQQDDLSEIKQLTNSIEKSYSEAANRNVNIDPGYMLLERFVLASGKNFTHRIYIGNFIYADLTLIYQKGAFRTLPWTYPDYADAAMIRHLERIRNRYSIDLKNIRKDEAI